jgi:hypothetical protein
LVAEQHLGVPVQCGRCARTFTTAPPVATPPLVGLDVGAASPGRVGERDHDCFLVRQCCWGNLDERHEVVVLAIADGAGMRGAAAALTPLLNNCLQGTSKEIMAVPESIAVACMGIGKAASVTVIRDGEIHVAKAGDSRIYHQRESRLAQVARPLKLAARDWLLMTSADLNAPALQADFGKSSSSAVQLAQQLAERAGQPILAVRCY